MSQDKKPGSGNTYVRVNKRENPFVQIDRSCFEDELLSWRGKGMMGYLLSRPNDWVIRKADLVKRSPDGKSVVEGALLDLMERGYIFYYPERDEKGRIEKWIYEVYESPELNPHREEGEAKAKATKEKAKARNKRKNDKRLSKPETDNPKIDEKQPETDNPEQDNPPLDYPPYTNNDSTNIDDEEDVKYKSLLNRELTKYEKSVVLLAKYYSVDEKEIEALIVMLGGKQYRHDAMEAAFQETIARQISGKVEYFPAYLIKTLKQKDKAFRDDMYTEASSKNGQASLTQQHTSDFPFYNWLENAD